jgi:precorrin-6y C5,15-methyltransferase (decarboxylating) CbiE subunit
MQEGRLFIVGVGPGSRDYLTEIAKDRLRNSDVVAGFEPPIETVRYLLKEDTEVLILDFANEEEVLKQIKDRIKEGKTCTICCVGDPTFSDKEFINKFYAISDSVELVPGISSAQIAFIKAHLTMEDTRLIVFHKKGFLESEKEDLLDAVRKGRDVLIVPRFRDFMPSHIASFLIDEGVSPLKKAIVYENLTLDDERVYEGSLGGVQHEDFGQLCIMVVKRDFVLKEY